MFFVWTSLAEVWSSLEFYFNHDQRQNIDDFRRSARLWLTVDPQYISPVTEPSMKQLILYLGNIYYKLQVVGYTIYKSE